MPDQDTLCSPSYFVVTADFGMNETDIQYASLMEELLSAYQQAAEGKGKERHGFPGPFEDQPSVRDCIVMGPVGPLFQARKKILESLRMDDKAALRELYGAINYVAMACIAIKARGGNDAG